ncbi:putative 2-dehydropantoate 2-reductase [Baaleninema simplex]|uniref:putative 2-dehydropantoate 2-reductase n=1 Tax=Baaleninema simplex TaxID=2862350 RepID=UPI0003493891|nr:putative 2-dehydropantoate 2-reductase [Baaleninema simplex]
MAGRRYAILGTGAIGGFYGACLQRAGAEVHFLLRSDYETVRRDGLTIDSVGGDFRLPHVNAYRDVSEMPKCDVVVLALKTTQNYRLPKLLPSVLADDGVVLVLQNGLGVEDEVAEIVGGDRVVGGLCFICSNKVGPGHIRHLDYGPIALADYTPGYEPLGVTSRLEAIGTDFKQAGIEIQFHKDLLLARWKKLVWNIPFNGLSVVLDAKTDRLIFDADCRQAVESLMAEVVRGAAACDRTVPESFVSNMLTTTEKMNPYLTSMKLDYDAGRSLEVEAIVGNPLRIADRAGVRLPQIELLYRQLKFLDRTKQNVKKSKS